MNAIVWGVQILATVGIAVISYVLGRSHSSRASYAAGHAEGLRLGINKARAEAVAPQDQGEIVAIIDSFDERWAAITLAKGDRPYDVEVDGL